MKKNLHQENLDLINDSLGLPNVASISRTIYLDSLEDNCGRERRARRTDAAEDNDSYLDEMDKAFMYHQESLEAHGMHII